MKITLEIINALKFFGPLETEQVKEKLKLRKIDLSTGTLVMVLQNLKRRGEIKLNLNNDGSATWTNQGAI